jgi:hypothetical protein
MTPNQRRPGFRLPWSSEEEAEARGVDDTTTPAAASPDAPSVASSPAPAQPQGVETSPAPADAPATPQPEPAITADAEPPDEFLRDLVAAMRRVAEESKQAGLADAQARAEERVKELDEEGERRRQELSASAETDIAAVGEWAKAEAARIKDEAERRVAARRTQLDEQLAADQARGEAEAKAIRDRIADYERELDAYHAQLAEISDPAAFAAAAKRMPRPPALAGAATAAAASSPKRAPAPTPMPAPAEPVADATSPASTNGQQPPAADTQPTDIHPAEEEVLAARLAELDASLPAEPVAPTAPAPAATAAPDTTEVVVSGLGSFGAITSFRQALADVDGVQGVALSLGGSGEFVFRATHRAGFDMGAAITSIEGDAATVQPRPEGGLLVKLERRR